MIRVLAILGFVLAASDGNLAVLVAEDDNQYLSEKFGIPIREFHFPKKSFLEQGYAPPGGYIKDFSIFKHNGRYHLFHIDGRPQERCIETGNEISFGHASTEDFEHWIRHNMPLAVGDRPWENEHVWAPYVCQWNDNFTMFYMARGKGTDQVISYATSKDLENWHKWEGGPILAVIGRDPFVRMADGSIYLYYTADGIAAAVSKDMVNWKSIGIVIRDPQRLQAESCSVHKLGNRYVLWYNDYLHTNDPSGDFRAVYVFGDDPLRFDYRNLKVFRFTTSLPTRYSPDDWLEKRPIPVSIELVEKGQDTWLVAYFRWHEDRFRPIFDSAMMQRPL